MENNADNRNFSTVFIHDYMLDAAYYSTMMVYQGDADGMMSGAAHTTQHTIRPPLQLIKAKPGVALVSSVFLMYLGDHVRGYWPYSSGFKEACQ